jgi:hypothetical protein
MEPEQTNVTLTADQIASLDLLIERKRAIEPDARPVTADIAGYAANVAANATVAAVTAGAMTATPAAAVSATVGAVATAVAVVTQVAGGDMTSAQLEERVREEFERAAREMPLDDLVALRNMAVQADGEGSR